MKKRRKMIFSALVLVVLAVFTFYLIFHGQDIAQIKTSLGKAEKRYLLVGLFCMFLFTLGEGLNIRRALQLFGYKVSYGQGVKYGMVGFFFSSITPSATGGQPMQLYYMHQDQLNMSHASLALLMELASYQVVTILYAVVSFVIQWRFMTTAIGNLRYLLGVGIFLNVALLFLVLVAIFSRRLIQKIVNVVLLILKALRLKNYSLYEQKAWELVKEYQNSAVYFRSSKRVMLKMLLISFLQITALHSVPFWIYKAFGLQQYSFWQIISLQAILFIAVSALPLPGTVGASESGFLVLFRTLFPSQILSGAMLLSRGISFYAYVTITGIVLLVGFLRKKWYPWKNCGKINVT